VQEKSAGGWRQINHRIPENKKKIEFLHVPVRVHKLILVIDINIGINSHKDKKKKNHKEHEVD
jgi:hypothetical protein